MDWEHLSIKDIRSAFLALPNNEQDAALDILSKDPRKGVQTFVKSTHSKQLRKAKEAERIHHMWLCEDRLHAKGMQLVIGTDEVGRGPLAGPVVAAAVILPRSADLPGINDSKKLTAEKREALNALIKDQALAWNIQSVDAETIDRINILHAAELAMSRAVEALGMGDYLLVDGTNRPNVNLPYVNLIKGDSRSISIAAASIIAKVYRDHLMAEYDLQYPGYHFAENKGYGTADHYQALHALGPCPLHRRSFRLY
jgi:ribonuclease HII